MPTTIGRCLLVSCFALMFAVCLAKDAHIVGRWADNLGIELWELANEIARPEELLEKYKSMNTRVEDKSGEELVSIISENVGRMLRRKMDAITCIRIAAEAVAENWDNTSLADGNFSYVSGKCSPVNGNSIEDSQCVKLKNDSAYREMELNADSHFYNIPVNTSYSSVHIPTNVFDFMDDIKEDIAKTELLDETFRQNYESDPALSWQYFGSVTGVLRQYPAMQWRTGVEDNDDNPDLYDCRVRSWFIEATTCSKDMVILMDISGSMTGMGKTIAKATVSSILDTLSNNDFVTLLKYSNETSELVPCFKDMLIQATPENIDTFKKSMENIKMEGVANTTTALLEALRLLKIYREFRGCDLDTPCNQLVMLVTDGIPENLTQVLEKWNREENGTHIPVRVFPLLLGMEVINVRETERMACLNRGSHRLVHTQEEVREQVLKYIPVVARPLVLQGVVHPNVWTHTYADITLGKVDSIDTDPSTLDTIAWQEYRMLTSVGTPVFDHRSSRDNKTRVTEDKLLGVAGTDVPIDDIRKLTLPYKLGVNGYAFIVSNNGYVVLHPDLRPVARGQLKLNYNSIDLTEVEILDDGRGPRNPGPEILELRSALVDHERGSMKGVPVKLHYDDNRRVTFERRNYFYAPLPGTPFSLAVAIPNYGTTWIKVGDEIRRNQNMNINVSDYFVGDRWRVHSSWVYCRYHYPKNHRFDRPEDELRHFLALMSRPGWRWSEQYEAYLSADEDVDQEPDCGRRTLKYDDYYCNKELMQLLVFDAKATNNSFYDGYMENLPRTARNLAQLYGIFIRFIATQSGLTRWHHFNASHLTETEKNVFGNIHGRAVNEPWYKGAIFQNEIDPNSISLSVSWESDADAVVTVSMSLSPKDGGKKAPAGVLGFQMPVINLYERFIELTSITTNPYMNCANDWIDCYLLDQNGYVIISEEQNDTGKFMGTIIEEGATMRSMVGQGLYKPFDIYDYQAWCHEGRMSNSANSMMEPLRHVGRMLIWFLLRLIWFATQFVDLPGIHGKAQSDEDLPDPPPPPKPYIHYYPCDQKRTLYMLNETVAAKGITNHSDYCSKPFYAQKVTHSNLLLVVVDNMYHPTCIERLDVTPVNILPFEYANSTAEKPCHKIPLNALKRRMLKSCFTEHPLEREIDNCAGASELTLSLSLLCITVIRILYVFA
ncbi:voltage-dependent calcium channel subunit alpha-2/delta-3 isoform X2 [Nylanderia fulva]|uniref:voltage-dependent calcium channel subunit alpha-2/delta-3 isoform X2 n=1 Tax=Nylanderia fulva TaxID=613905 RepID=UPI0010FAD69C|nr:voltage-dependent calcium channel subunit alpha-2/delta-3 isoform X2 [Nylanderia fulva]